MYSIDGLSEILIWNRLIYRKRSNEEMRKSVIPKYTDVENDLVVRKLLKMLAFICQPLVQWTVLVFPKEKKKPYHPSFRPTTIYHIKKSN